MKLKPFVILLVVLAIVRLTLMATMPVFDPSEARYATLAANMCRSGDFTVPHFTHNGKYQSFDGKPPLVFQAGGAFCRLFGVNEFAVRLFPFLSAVLLLAILYSSVKKSSGPESARLAVAVCATSTAFFAASGMSMTDITLACCTGGSLLLYRNFIADGAFRHQAGIAALLGAGMIVKGPVSLAMFGLPVLADAIINHRWRSVFNWRWLAALPVFLLVAVPWFVLVEERNPGSVWYFFYNENFLRFVTHDYGDKYGAGREKFRGVAILWAFISVLPWALLPLWETLRRFSANRFRGISFNLKGIVPNLQKLDFAFLSFLVITGFWCLTSRVLLYYLFPVIALFAASFAARWGNRAARFVPIAAGITLVVTIGALLGGAVFSDKMAGAATPQYYGYHNRYSHEFYHGTDPAAKTEKGVEKQQLILEMYKRGELRP